jgi:hypothetical protein
VGRKQESSSLSAPWRRDEERLGPVGLVSNRILKRLKGILAADKNIDRLVVSYLDERVGAHERSLPGG